MAGYDVIVVGSGMNSLVCAALLTKAGRRVLVLEQADVLGGCIRSAELFPGFIHDLLSQWYPLFLGGPAFAELGDDLATAGVEFANTPKPTGVLTGSGASLVLTTDRAENMRRFDAAGGDGARFAAEMDAFLSHDAELAFGLLGQELWSAGMARTLFSEGRRRGFRELTAFIGESLEPARPWLERIFETEVARALVAPWMLHVGLGPDDAYSAVMAKIILAALEMGGMPVVVGGSSRIVDAFRAIVEDGGGTMRTGAEVERVVVDRGRAVGVRTIDGEEHRASRAVICNVTPTQLYGRLLEGVPVPKTVTERVARYRYGRADMQIHYALEAPPEWTDPELGDVAIVHLCDGIDAQSKAMNEADRGLLPGRATVVVGQPTAVDPSRAPDGKWIIWVQLQELPRQPRGDALGEITVDRGWSPALGEAYANRIQGRLEEAMPGFSDLVLGQRILTPADLEAMNPNLVGGDPYSGSCDLDQFFLWRPYPGAKGHETPVKGLYHIGASTHPGPGLGGGSGYLVAKALS